MEWGETIDDPGAAVCIHTLFPKAEEDAGTTRRHVCGG
eukprot:CAMPEP_0170635724 /NCGR_PEP_ID=MMETSP0224-20130122/37382_1 /TAXON_ID=285029 /ORGANISM="Togula jolla, Strain CCCM 725" /LENGTH=37 /DNA_ID= /DNA_START= /DNA_END= /DNA_ORIENTATION=